MRDDGCMSAPGEDVAAREQSIFARLRALDLRTVEEERAPGEGRTVDAILAERWCVAAATPGGVYQTIKERWEKALFGRDLIDCLVLDEASQMNVPVAAIAALPLKPDG